MRILILSPEYLPATGGGIITFYRHLLPIFAAAGHDVRIVHGSGFSSTNSTDRPIIEGVRTEMLDDARLRRQMVRFNHLQSMPRLRTSLAGAWALWEQAMEGGGADVIEVCDWGLLFLPPMLECAAPVINQLHGSMGQIGFHDPVDGEESQDLLVRLLEHTALSETENIQTYSDSNASFWRGQIRSEVVKILPAWRAPATVDPAIVNEYGLVLGRVQQWKGPDVLCQAMIILGHNAPSINWHGRDTDAGKHGPSLSRKLGQEYSTIWGSKIRHLAQVTPDAAFHLQRAARFILVPSTWDVFNFTCVEAMAAGRPVICSSGAGASELIEDGVNGFVFKTGNAVELAEAIERVQGLNESQARQIGSAARETVARELDPDRIAAIRLGYYNDAIGRFKLGQAPVSDWLRDACSRRDASSTELAYLNRLPLKPLLTYGTRRLVKKLLGLVNG